jgi:hypothetical protein
MNERLEAAPLPVPRCLLCPRPAFMRGLCRAHYATAWKLGMVDRVGLPSRRHARGLKYRRPR